MRIFAAPCKSIVNHRIALAMVLAIIPARFASTRFPGKPLVNIQGKTMIIRVCEQVKQANAVNEMVVATDDIRIYDHVKAGGYPVLMTQPDHPSGTDRCAEVALKYPQATHILNIQGDEPFIQPEQINLLTETLLHHPKANIATLVRRITDLEQLTNPNVVKAVLSVQQEALYFSRQALPYCRAAGQDQPAWLESAVYYKHIGLYGFSRAALLAIAKLDQTPLEKAESLEQLRWLEHGYRIAAGITDQETFGIDTPEDLLRFVQ